jgi:hypothetical protein
MLGYREDLLLSSLVKRLDGQVRTTYCHVKSHVLSSQTAQLGNAGLLGPLPSSTKLTSSSQKSVSFLALLPSTPSLSFRRLHGTAFTLFRASNIPTEAMPAY